MRLAATADAGPEAETPVLDETRRHAAQEGLFQVPRLETGTDTFEVDIPASRQLALIDLATTEDAPLASAEIAERPQAGATGRVTIRVRWSHPVPMGQIAYRLRVHASQDGRPPAVLVSVGEPAIERRLRALVEQDAPVDLAVTGPMAEAFHQQILERGGQVVPLARSMDGGVVSGPTAAVIVSLAVIAAICVALGLAVLAGVVIFAISKGYNIDNAGYKVGVGEGASRQEHQMVFNIRQPGS